MYDFSNSYAPRMEVVKVAGYNGANAFPMGANSSVLLLDENEPVLWVVKTDGAAYKTITPFSITAYQPPKDPAISSIEERISKLEEMIYAKSSSANAES